MVQEANSPVKYLVRQRCTEGFNSGVKGLIGTVKGPQYPIANMIQGTNILYTVNSYITP
jgi:hypothetical protein